MHKTKESNLDQKTTVQERCVGISGSSTHGALFLEKICCSLRSRTTFADVNKIKSSKFSASVYLKM